MGLPTLSAAQERDETALNDPEVRALVERQEERIQQLKKKIDEYDQRVDSIVQMLCRSQLHSNRLSDANLKKECRDELWSVGRVPDSEAEALRAAGVGSGANSDQQQERVSMSAQVAQAQNQRGSQRQQGASTPEEDRPEIQLLSDRGGVLLEQGSFAFEPAIEYTNTQNTLVEVTGFTVLPAILIGRFDVGQTQRESVTGSLTGRYGVTDNFELEVRVPYVYRRNQVTSRPVGEEATEASTTTISADGVGDVEVAAHYQLPTDWTGDSFVVSNLRFKTRTGKDPFEIGEDELPTGTGFYSVEPSLTGILPTDPAVLFGSLSYNYTIARDIAGLGEIDPGDEVGANFGFGFSLNENFSVSTSYDHTMVFETEQDGQKVDGSRTLQIGRLLFGGTYRFNPGFSFTTTVGAGVTEDAPDLSVTLRPTFRF
jgi:cell division septum initiation protein DivIVA